MASPPQPLFSVRRSPPILVAPAQSTPNELLPLSEIDDQDTLRFHFPGIRFYRGDHHTALTAAATETASRDPAHVIRGAISEALVHFYPLAGRIRELDGRKLAVECTGQGILFVEADADATIDQLVACCGDGELHPPFPFLDDILHEADGYGAILDSPLVLVQVTKLACGGFICALKTNHTLIDATGMSLFMNAVAEIARGGPARPASSWRPVWCRELLQARVPPRVTCAHPQYEPMPASKSAASGSLVRSGGAYVFDGGMAYRSVFFGPNELAELRNRFLSANRLGSCSTFDLITACLWRCRTAALQLHPDDEVRALCIVNVRQRVKPPLPAGYYGNAFVESPAVSTAGELCTNSLAYAVELVQKAKAAVTEEYVRSLVDMLAVKGRPHVTEDRRSIGVSDLTRAGLEQVDFGWGLPLYAGPTSVDDKAFFYVPFLNRKGERGILVPVCLAVPVMDRFTEEFEKMVNGDLE